MEFKDYYSTLGVAKTATEKEIKQTYRKLARKHHPDVNPDDKSAEARFKEINEAYEVLGDPAKRKKYDELGANWRMYEQAGAAGRRPGAGAGTSAAGPQGGGFRTMTEEEMREMFGDGDPFSDFFHTFFGGAAGPMGGLGGAGSGGARPDGRGRVPRQGRDVEHELQLGLEDAYHGTTRRLSMTHDGQARTVDVRIPPGVGDGSRVRVGGEGEHGTGGAQSGDSVPAHPACAASEIRAQGARSLYTRLGALDDRCARRRGGNPDACGQARAAQDSADDAERAGVPAEGSWDARCRQAGRARRPYATVDVELPRELTPEQRTHFEALQKLENGTKNSAA